MQGIEAASVQRHYGPAGLTDRIREALEQAGLSSPSWEDLVPLDQFHAGGLEGTEVLARSLNPEKGDRVLDVGSGVGGPARFLAAKYGCHVTGIDLSEPFVEASKMLTELCGLSSLCDFLQGNALDLPFPEASFDHAWTIHVGMNIADRATFYRGVRRAVKPLGRFGLYDIVSGEHPIRFPVPWAKTPDISFLTSIEETHNALGDAGFTEIAVTDLTAEGLLFFRKARENPPAKDSDKLSLGVVMGSDFGQLVANLGANFEEGRARLVQIVAK